MTLFTAIPVIDGMPEVVDLLHLRMEARALRAEFSFGGDDPRRLAVTFSAVAVLRALDDAHWSTEHDEPCEGLSKHHFAYEVDGARFWRAQSSLITDQRGRRQPFRHYAFLTGWTCVDVISDQRPIFAMLAP